MMITNVRMDLIVALTACPAEMSNNYSYKPIGFKVSDKLMVVNIV